MFSVEFIGVLLSYVVLTSLYSIFFKKLVIADVIVLAVLYTLRIFGGGVALDITLSPWLVALSMFLFFSLACIKRIAELAEAKINDKSEISGRGYRAIDAQSIAQACSASACCAVLVLVLYVNDSSVSSIYSNPTALWSLVPFLLYWILRLLLLAQRGEILEDPVVFALKDKVSYLMLCAAILSGMCAL